MSRRITYVSILIFAAIFAAVQPVGAQHPAQTPPGNYLEVEGSKIYYEECGAGPAAVLLIHDGIAHSAVWDDVCWSAIRPA